MQAVRTVVALQLIHRVAQLELSILDAVGVAAYAGTIVRGRIQRVGILLDVVETQYHVSGLAILVGYYQRHDSSTVVGDAYLHTVLVFQRVELDGLFVDEGVKLGRIQS